MQYKHLKYGLPMINDLVRNSFYKTILQDTKDKVCLEIGFGSGILSILAIEAGAKHIVAYEEDLETYDLGIKVIKELNLQDKITLIGERFESNKISNHTNIDCIFTETIDQTLWGESLLDALQHNVKLPKIIPNIYFLEAHALEIGDNFAKTLIDNDSNICNPGIELNPKFSDTINKIMNITTNKVEAGLHGVQINNMHKLVNITGIHNRTPEQSYSVDLNDPVPVSTKIKWEVKLEKEKNYLVVLRTGMLYKSNKLYTDVCLNWGPLKQYPLIYNAQDNLIIEQNFADGNFVFSYNDQVINYDQ